MITERRRRTDRQQLALTGVQVACHLLALTGTVTTVVLVVLLLIQQRQSAAQMGELLEQLRSVRSSVNTLHRRIDGVQGVIDGRPN